MMDKVDTLNRHVLKYILIAIAVITVTSASISGIFLSNNIAPVIVGSVPLIFVVFIMFVRKPVLALYTALIINLLPLGLIPASLQSNLNRLLAVVALLVWGIYLLVRRSRIVWTTTATVMAIFIVWCIMTFFWLQNMQSAINELGAYILRFILFLFLVPNEIKKRKDLDSIMLILAMAGWVYITAGMVALATQGYQVGTRLKILESNENTLGGLFPVVAVGMIWMAVRPWNRQKSLWNFLTLLFLLLSFILVALTGSRGGAISWALTVFLLLLWPQTRSWGVKSILILVVVAIVGSVILSTTISRFTDTTSDTLLGGREALWQAAWLSITNHPITGVGIGNSSREIIAYVRLFRGVGNASSASVHNPLLTVWVEMGLPGILMYLGVLLSALWIFIRKFLQFRKSNVQWIIPYFALTTAGFVGYFASWIKGGGMQSAFSYFLMLSLLIIPSHIETGEEST